MMYDVASDMIIAYRGEHYLYYKVLLPGYPLTITSSVCVIRLKYRIILFTDSFFAIVFFRCFRLLWLGRTEMRPRERNEKYEQFGT